EIVGEFIRERHFFDNDGERIVIAEVRLLDGTKETIKGPAEERALTFGLSYRFWGHYTHHERYGRQFAFSTFVTEEPLSEGAIITYLATQCKGVGSATASKIYERYGPQSISALRDRPVEVAYNTRGLTEEKAKAAAEVLKKKTGKERATAEMMGLIHGYGFYRSTVNDALSRWGSSAAKKVRKNPYHLLRLKGCGFLKVDQLYLDLKHSPGTLKRQTLCGIDALHRSRSGDTWHSSDVFHDALLTKVSGASVQLNKAVELGVRSKILRTKQEGRLWMADAKDAYHEQTLADCIARIVTDEGRLWPDISDVSEHQREQTFLALQRRIGVLSGRPGTGKTYTTARIIKAILKAGYGSDDVSVVAPTGKASQRLSQALSDAGVPVVARTIHSLLFAPRESKYLNCQFLFVDESSMLDTTLASELFRAIGPETHVLLIGDTHQLPPVGHGAPLRDFIEASIPTGELTEIQRNSGMIVRACSEIVERRRFICSEKVNLEEGDNLVHIEEKDESPCDITALIQKLSEKFDVDPLTGVQVLVATNRIRKSLNKKLQDALNPNGMKCKGTPFRVGDKVINLKNTSFKLIPKTEDVQHAWHTKDEVENLTVPVANGEQGIVLSVSPGQMIVRLDARDICVMVRWRSSIEGNNESDDESGAGCTWDLAYAISVHKSQGSEWPICIVIVDSSGGRIQSRQWLYTAISRAKRLCVTVGKRSAVDLAVRTDGTRRKTFLKELIIEEVAGIKRRRVAEELLNVDWNTVLGV
ncbi:MAG TPA: AAA family ATPase, partial [Planctomicrobium sp.]|nr:AAA family ATPase [Planctomicrobium sp.]